MEKVCYDKATSEKESTKADRKTRENGGPLHCRKTGLRRAFLRKYDVLQKEEKFFEKTLDIPRISGIITIVPSFTAHEQNRICGYGGIGRRVRFRF